MKKRIIILGQGRSGSTLIQRILHCCVKDSFFCGENNNFWYHVFNSYNAYSRISKKDKKQSYTISDEYKPCWFHPYKQSDLLNNYRNLFDEMYFSKNYNVFGFKEVRFPETEEKLIKYVEFFRNMFPDIYFIFSVRETSSIINSGWWKKEYEDDKTETVNKLNRMYNNLVNLSKSMDNIILIKYDEMVDYRKISNLLKSINLDIDEIQYNRIINNKLV